MKKLLSMSVLLAVSGVVAAEPAQEKAETALKTKQQAETVVEAKAPTAQPVLQDEAKKAKQEAEKAEQEMAKKVDEKPTEEKGKQAMVEDIQTDTIAVDAGGAVIITKFDKDKDGKLTIKEAMSDPVLLASFGKLDVDGDGQLTEIELNAAAEVGEQS